MFHVPTSKWFFYSIAYLGIVTLLCCLGYWQLSRATQKQDWLLQQQTAFSQKPLSKQALITQLPEEHARWRFRPVSFKGTFLSQYTIFLDNKTHQGQVGYHVLVPVALDNQRVILIDRGFTPMGASRSHLPTITTPTGEITIEGYLDFAYRNPFISRSVENSLIQWPLRMQQLDYALLGRHWGKVIYPMLVILKKNAHGALTPPQGPSVEWLNTERHRAYAFQWFALTIAFTVLFAFYHWKTAHHDP